MQRGIDQLLRELENLTLGSRLSGLGQLEDLPRIICEHLKLEAVGLKLFHFLNRGRRSLQHPAGPPPDLAPTGLQMREACETGSCLTLDSAAIYPLVVHGQSVGVLWLVGDLSAAEQRQIFRVVQLVGVLLENAERNFVRHSRFLAIMSRKLHASESLAELVSGLTKGLLRYNRTTAVALRPVYGGTVLGGSFLGIIPGMRKWQPLYCQLEEDIATQLLNGTTTPVLHHLPRQFPSPDESQPNLLLLPLRMKGNQIGILTLFGGAWAVNASGEINLFEQEFLQSLAEEIAHCLDRQLARERFNQLLEDRGRKLRENATLYRINRAIHGTLQLDKLAHLILSVATVPDGGGFERALLLMLNERSQSLQGMLGVSRETAQLLLPAENGISAWESPCLTDENLQVQREAQVNRLVLKQRISLNADSPLARAVRTGKVVLVSPPEQACSISAALDLSSFACVPLVGKNRRLGVLVIDNPNSKEPIAVDQVRFLELFATLAAAAVENSMLLGRLEKAHQELIDTQEKLIQGERLAVLGEMSASVAHELKNPLVSIGGFARRLARLQDSGPLQQEYAEIIARETSRMEEMLSQILAFSKKQILCMEPCALESIIDNAVEAANEAIESSGAKLVRETDNALPLIVADRQKLRQVLVNLIINACQVTRSGGELWLRARNALLRGEEAVEIDIEDVGGGIAPEILRNIFNPFFTTKEEGTGLGLPISQRIVEHHHGEIEVYNTDRGARFTLRIPVRQNSTLLIDKSRNVG